MIPPRLSVHWLGAYKTEIIRYWLDDVFPAPAWLLNISPHQHHSLHCFFLLYQKFPQRCWWCGKLCQLIFILSSQVNYIKVCNEEHSELQKVFTWYHFGLDQAVRIRVSTWHHEADERIPTIEVWQSEVIIKSFARDGDQLQHHQLFLHHQLGAPSVLLPGDFTWDVFLQCCGEASCQCCCSLSLTACSVVAVLTELTVLWQYRLAAQAAVTLDCSAGWLAVAESRLTTNIQHININNRTGVTTSHSIIHYREINYNNQFIFIEKLNVHVD